MNSKLYDILEWVKSNGEVKAMDRLRVKVLPVTMKEGLVLTDVTYDTTCSPETLRVIRDAATEIVGKECPISLN